MIQLQSILFPTEEVCGISELYYHREGKRIDYNGYFNLFYLEKWKKYTNTQNLTLHIRCKGYRQLILVHDEKDLWKRELDGENLQEYQVEFPYSDYDRGCFWFALIEDDTTETSVEDAYLATELPAGEQRKVNIGIDICTYRREAYVTRNIRQLRDKVLLNRQIQASDHVKAFLIDNGQTLQNCDEFQELHKTCEEKVTVIPNMNAGGAGGFTRGMLEVLKRKNAENFTHVLLMDDDAVLEPDTIVRIYGFLSVVKDEWKDITIGGAMLREDYPHMLFCAGEIWDNADISRPKMHLDLRELSEASCDYLTETGHEHEWYSGWWCCCYSLNTVREDNLPIPLFFHHDDIEFGLRNRNQGIVFLNGVSVWHRGAELTFPGSNIYYDVRNNLIEIALHQEYGNCKRIAEKLVFKAMVAATIRMKYQEVLLVYRGVMDFMKGADWLVRQKPDLLNTEIRNMAYQMKPLEEWKKSISVDEYKIIEKQIQKRMETFGLSEIVNVGKRKKKAPCHYYLTGNGWLLPSMQGDLKVLLPVDSPFENYRRREVLLYEPGSGKAFLLRKRYKDLIRAVARTVRILGVLEFGFSAAAKKYKADIHHITNQKSWEEYLKL